MAKDVKSSKKHHSRSHSKSKKIETTKKKSKIKNNSIKIVKESISHKRKWNEVDDKTNSPKKFKIGKFSPEEEKKIEKALCQYAYEKSYTNDELLSLITDKLENNTKKIWPIIAECLPDRSVQSIHNFCHRKYHPNNYQGFWSKEEEKNLINLVKEHGKKWTLIASKLDRTPTNVKDKYKELGSDNYNNNNKNIFLIKILKLLKIINNFIDDEKYHIFNCVYKFKDDIDKKYDNIFKFKKHENKFYIDSSIKNESSEVIIKNILKRILNMENLSKIIEEKIEIPWSLIAKKLEFYSVDTCRNIFKKIIGIFAIESISEKKKNLQMINKIIDLDYENIDEINWDYIRVKRKTEENKVKLNELIKNFDPYGTKNFSEILDKIKEELEKELEKKEGKNSDNDEEDDDEREFKEELRKRDKNNIIKIYEKYKNNKFSFKL